VELSAQRYWVLWQRHWQPVQLRCRAVKLARLHQAQIVSCGNEFVTRSCAVLSNGASFPIEAGETGVSFGNETLRIVLQLDEGGLPSGIGQLTNSETGDVQGMRWVSLGS